MGLVVSAGSPVPREPFPAAADLSSRAQKVAIGAETAQLYQRPFQLTCAQVREVMEVMAAGSFAKKFQALQQASTMSS